MGNQHSAASAHRARKNVHWKTAGRPAAPGKPDIVPLQSEEEPNAITLRWAAPAHDGGAALRGYQVECNRLGAAEWVRTAPPVVQRPELLLSGLQPPHRYQFRVAALNAVGRSDYSELSDVLAVGERTPLRPPAFTRRLEDVTALENDKTEFRVEFEGAPPPVIAWFKDDYEIFSSRRTAIATTDAASVLVFHQTLPSDEGEVKCTATNRAGHAVTRARLLLEAAPKLRYPRQYEDGLLYEVNETIVLKTTVVGKPPPAVEWRHDGRPLATDERVQIVTTPRLSTLKIAAARRSDRGEYQVSARNAIGEDAAAFLVTVTAPPQPPRGVTVARQVDKSVTLAWRAPEDDGGCRVGNYVVEYYRSGWDVWLKATASRQTSVTLFDLIEGSEYRFRVKAESPYGMSAPSAESAPVRIPGEAADMDFLAVESRIINEALTRREGEAPPVSPAPRRKRTSAPSSPLPSPLSSPLPAAAPPSPPPPRKQKRASLPGDATSNEFMLVLYPDNAKTENKSEKRKSFQLDLEDALSPPPISLSAPELRSRSVLPFKALRNAVSSTELLHERAMARFYKAVALKERQKEEKQNEKPPQIEPNHIPYNNVDRNHSSDQKPQIIEETKMLQMPEIVIKQDSFEDNKLKPPTPRQNSDNSDKWQQISFEEDYTASTVSTDGDYTDEDEVDSLTEEIGREGQLAEEEVYHPRNKTALPQPVDETIDEEEEEEEREPVKPLPLLDPNFVPKPILKKRVLPTPVPTLPARTVNANKKVEPNKKQETDTEDNQKKEEKMTLFKKIKQKPFSFLNKKDIDKSTKAPTEAKEEKSTKKVEKTVDKYDDEGRTVIDYYGNIVKEYGTPKRPTTPLYLNTEDLKQVAEQQSNKEATNDNNNVPDKPPEPKQPKKKQVKKVSENKVNSVKKKRILPKEKQKPQKDKPKEEKLEKPNQQLNNSTVKKSEKPPGTRTEDTRVLLKTTERATVVIPIDYKELEERAKVNVRSAIDYTVDICLLLLAFWVYFFKDERLAIPFLILIIYRQLQETIFRNIPEWIGRHTPQWLKKKTS
ncbi:muscle M-line assembly protein unc-89 [Maniola jurtina]|uniref:muscle M-line assembly protein unc-89 n=1 Tax=Maniola jurtina TaxID=191418 RepID=UPI001E68F2F1|nr:muscle M-line assembly protein unc-89 [Maniola jurtina]